MRTPMGRLQNTYTIDKYESKYRFFYRVSVRKKEAHELYEQGSVGAQTTVGAEYA